MFNTHISQTVFFSGSYHFILRQSDAYKSLMLMLLRGIQKRVVRFAAIRLHLCIIYLATPVSSSLAANRLRDDRLFQCICLTRSESALSAARKNECTTHCSETIAVRLELLDDSDVVPDFKVLESFIHAAK